MSDKNCSRESSKDKMMEKSSEASSSSDTEKSRQIAAVILNTNKFATSKKLQEEYAQAILVINDALEGIQTKCMEVNKHLAGVADMQHRHRHDAQDYQKILKEEIEKLAAMGIAPSLLEECVSSIDPSPHLFEGYENDNNNNSFKTRIADRLVKSIEDRIGKSIEEFIEKKINEKAKEWKNTRHEAMPQPIRRTKIALQQRLPTIKEQEEFCKILDGGPKIPPGLPANVVEALESWINDRRNWEYNRNKQVEKMKKDLSEEEEHWEKQILNMPKDEIDALEFAKQEDTAEYLTQRGKEIEEKANTKYPVPPPLTIAKSENAENKAGRLANEEEAYEIWMNDRQNWEHNRNVELAKLRKEKFEVHYHLERQILNIKIDDNDKFEFPATEELVQLGKKMEELKNAEYPVPPPTTRRMANGVKRATDKSKALKRELQWYAEHIARTLQDDISNRKNGVLEQIMHEALSNGLPLEKIKVDMTLKGHFKETNYVIPRADNTVQVHVRLCRKKHHDKKQKHHDDKKQQDHHDHKKHKKLETSENSSDPAGDSTIEKNSLQASDAQLDHTEQKQMHSKIPKRTKDPEVEIQPSQACEEETAPDASDDKTSQDTPQWLSSQDAEPERKNRQSRHNARWAYGYANRNRGIKGAKKSEFRDHKYEKTKNKPTPPKNAEKSEVVPHSTYKYRNLGKKFKTPDESYNKGCTKHEIMMEYTYKNRNRGIRDAKESGFVDPKYVDEPRTRPVPPSKRAAQSEVPHSGYKHRNQKVNETYETPEEPDDESGGQPKTKHELMMEYTYKNRNRGIRDANESGFVDPKYVEEPRTRPVPPSKRFTQSEVPHSGYKHRNLNAAQRQDAGPVVDRSENLGSHDTANAYGREQRARLKRQREKKQAAEEKRRQALKEKYAQLRSEQPKYEFPPTPPPELTPEEIIAQKRERIATFDKQRREEMKKRNQARWQPEPEPEPADEEEQCDDFADLDPNSAEAKALFKPKILDNYSDDDNAKVDNKDEKDQDQQEAAPYEERREKTRKMVDESKYVPHPPTTEKPASKYVFPPTPPPELTPAEIIAQKHQRVKEFDKQCREERLRKKKKKKKTPAPVAQDEVCTDDFADLDPNSAEAMALFRPKVTTRSIYDEADVDDKASNKDDADDEVAAPATKATPVAPKAASEKTRKMVAESKYVPRPPSTEKPASPYVRDIDQDDPAGATPETPSIAESDVDMEECRRDLQNLKEKTQRKVRFSSEVDSHSPPSQKIDFADMDPNSAEAKAFLSRQITLRDVYGCDEFPLPSELRSPSPGRASRNSLRGDHYPVLGSIPSEVRIPTPEASFDRIKVDPPNSMYTSESERRYKEPARNSGLQTAYSNPNEYQEDYRLKRAERAERYNRFDACDNVPARTSPAAARNLAAMEWSNHGRLAVEAHRRVSPKNLPYINLNPRKEWDSSRASPLPPGDKRAQRFKYQGFERKMSNKYADVQSKISTRRSPTYDWNSGSSKW